MFVLTLREGIEAFLIIAIILAYLRKSNRNALIPSVFFGIGAAIVASGLAGWAFSQAENQPLWEGILSLIAAGLVVSMIIYMMKAARFLRANLETKMSQLPTDHGTAAKLGIFMLVLLMITREGMEMALVAASLAGQTSASNLIAGAVLGVLGAVAVAWAWARYGHRVNLGRFFQITATFLLLFAAQLVFQAFHEFTEIGILPLDNAYWHGATEAWTAEGDYGIWITAAMLVVPLLWLALEKNLFQPRWLKPPVHLNDCKGRK